MIFANIFYFFSAVVILSFTTGESNLIDFPINFMWIIVLIVLFFNYSRSSFSRLRQKYDEDGQQSVFKNDFNKLVNRGMIFALFIFSVSVILFDLKYLLLQLYFLKGMEGLPNIILILFFLSLLSFVWYWSYKYFSDIYTLGNSAWKHIVSNIRFNLAILIPWVIIIVINDIVSLLHLNTIKTSVEGLLGQFGVFLFYLAVFILFTPFMITKVWESKLLDDVVIKGMIENYCKRERVKFKGILLWKALNESLLTAAVIGVIYPFRYLLLTPKLTRLLNREEILAVVSHEVGHIKKKHIILYILFFLTSMPIIVSISTYLVSMVQLVEPGRSLFLLLYGPNNIFPNILLVFFTLFFFILYFRYFFGYLMRNFERQADLYCFESGVNPEYLISAFEKLNSVINEPENSKNWHHFNISERIGFIKRCIEKPEEIKKHNKKVKKAVLTMGVSVLLVLSISFNFIFKGNFISEKEGLLLNIDIVKSMLKKTPDNYKLYGNYGMLNYIAENWKEAISGFENSLKIEPNQPDILNNLAWLLLTCKNKTYRDKTKALRYAKLAWEMVDEEETDNYVYIIDTLAEAYYQNGLYKQAFKLAKRAMNLSKDNKKHYKKQYEKMKKASLQNAYSEII